MASKLSPLTLEKALGRLLGLMGHQVEVTIFSEEPYGPLATFQGELSTGGEIRRPVYSDRDEAFIFRLAGEGASSFVLESRMLRRAFLVTPADDRPHSLRFLVGSSTVLQVNPLEGERSEM
jgi:hypothetical protein